MSETVPDNGINDTNDINGDPHHPRSFLSKNLLLLWDYAVNIVVEFIVAVLSHAKVQECLNRSILVAVTALLEHPDLPNKIDSMTQHYTEDLSRHHQAARQIGKDVPKLVGGFMGGLMSNVTMTKGRKGTNSAPAVPKTGNDEIEQMYFGNPKKDK
jgi:hypothetical protein